MRVVVDPDRCQGHARCVLTASPIFDIDDESGHAVSVLDELPADLVEKAGTAAGDCPEGAISVLP